MKKQLMFLVKILVSTTLVLLLYHHVSFEQLRSLALNIHWTNLVFLLPLLFLNSILNTWKWRLFLQAGNMPIPFRSLLGTQLIGTFFNIFMPSNIGGDAYRVYDISRQTGHAMRSFTSVFADRLSGFLALTLFGMVSSMVGYGLHSNLRIIIPPLVVFLCLSVGILLIIQKTGLLTLLRWVRLDRVETINRLLEKFVDAFAEYARRPGLLANVLAISLVFYGVMVMFVYCLAMALGFHIPLGYFFIYVPMIALMESIPLSVYGIGFRDAGYVFFFAEVGLSGTEALTLSLVYVAVTLLYSLVGGLLLAGRMFRGEASAGNGQAGPPTPSPAK